MTISDELNGAGMRMGDMLCYARKYYPAHADSVKLVAANYMASLRTAASMGALGKDSTLTSDGEGKE